MEEATHQQQTHEGIGPRDVFLQLLAIVTLYLSAVAFGTLLFQFINTWIPDALESLYAATGRSNSIRFALASLVVVFPVYIWVTLHLQKDIRLLPARSDMRSRKWLLNFTLFATAIVIIIDLITLVYRYLDGDVSMRFFFKILVVLVIALVIFKYYLWNLRTKGQGRDAIMKRFGQIVIGLVALATLGGFALAGSPQSARRAAFDERRVNDLAEIQWQIVSYWQEKDTLPDNLDALYDSLRGYRAAVDPETQEPYEYTYQGDLTFTLCATFTTSSTSTNSPAPTRVQKYYPPSGIESFDSWTHDAGQVCFEREIDPDRYRIDTLIPR